MSCVCPWRRRALLLQIYILPVSRLFYRGLSSFDGLDVSTMGKVVKLVDNFDSLYEYVTNEGTAFWFRTNMDSPKYKVRFYDIQYVFCCFWDVVVELL